MVGDEFYYLCRGTGKNSLLLEKIMNAFKKHQGSISSVVGDLSYDTELSVDLTASSLGVVVSDYVVAKIEPFPRWDCDGAYEPASDAELKEFLGIK